MQANDILAIVLQSKYRTITENDWSFITNRMIGTDARWAEKASKLYKENSQCNCKFMCNTLCENYKLCMDCTADCSMGDLCKNQQFTKNKYYTFLEVLDTNSKGLGVRSIVDIDAGAFVVEYVGEVISIEEFNFRCEEQQILPMPYKTQHYSILLNNSLVIDSHSSGNIARFINHSCEPNCIAKVWVKNGRDTIGIFASKKIKSGEVLTYDYRYQTYGDDTEAMQCYCGSRKCRRWIGTCQ
jgi:SET domain-containing protein